MWNTSSCEKINPNEEVLIAKRDIVDFSYFTISLLKFKMDYLSNYVIEERFLH